MVLLRTENLELHCVCDVNDINKNVFILYYNNGTRVVSSNILELIISEVNLTLEDALLLTKINKEYET